MRPRRRAQFIAAIVLIHVVAFATLWVGTSWKRAADDVSAMTIPTVVLPPDPTTFPETAATEQAASSDASALVAQATAIPAPTEQPNTAPVPDKPMNILFLGTDARVGEDISRTDAIIVVHLDPRTNRAAMLSLPRDLWVDIPGYGKNKINAAYPIGEKKYGNGGGAALAKKTVGNLLDLQIDHFMLINFEGFQTLIDKLDGVTIDVAKAIDDPKYPMDAFEGDVRTMKIHFDAGPQQMDGERALIYARTRHADSDFGRIQRQQQVIMAIFDKMRQKGLMSQITSIDEYTSTLRDYVRFDLNRGDILSLAQIAPNFSINDVQRFSVGPKMVSAVPQSTALKPDQRALQRVVREMVGESVASADGQPATP